MKCGNCQAKSKEAKSQPPRELSEKSRSFHEWCSAVAVWPAAAHQPMRGGIPPTMAPTHVLAAENRFMGVYTPAYRKMFKADSPATVGFVPTSSRISPLAPQSTANTRAALREMRLRTKGLFLVLVINASYLGSKSMFSVFAQAHDKNVPVVRNRNVRVEVDSVVWSSGAAEVDKISGIGYSEYADVVVRRMRKESRGFVRDRYVANLLRRMADLGSDVAAVVNCEDASKGSCASS